MEPEIEGVIDPQDLHPEVKDIFVAYRETFSTASGQKVLDDLKKSYQDRTTYVKGDVNQTLINEGARTVYLLIVAMMTEGRLINQQNDVEVGRATPVTEVIT